MSDSETMSSERPVLVVKARGSILRVSNNDRELRNALEMLSTYIHEYAKSKLKVMSKYHPASGISPGTPLVNSDVNNLNAIYPQLVIRSIRMRTGSQDQVFFKTGTVVLKKVEEDKDKEKCVKMSSGEEDPMEGSERGSVAGSPQISLRDELKRLAEQNEMLRSENSDLRNQNREFATNNRQLQERMDRLEALVSQQQAQIASSAAGNTVVRDEEMANAPVKTAKATSTPAEKREEKPPKIPPVVLRKANNWTHVSRLLLSKKAQWSKAKLTLDGVVIHPVSADDHRLITRTLEADKQEYHTYSLQEEKTLRVVVRGIPTGIAEEEVKSDLQAQGFTVLVVHRMVSRKTKEALPLVLVQVPRAQTKILEVRRCCALVVRVEKQRQQAGVNQCHRCQRFGHGQSKCTAQHKCVKCGASHATATCQRPREEPASYANCGGSHPASYRGCEKFPKLVKKTTAAPARNPAPQTNRGNAQNVYPRPGPPEKMWSGKEGR
ncbi:hypothetical protein NQ315_012411 [Exocentrus adspersus]|uniref:Pre-C2HC domain-containing protein n=1 Tax=Exocentrus adspersus TaxID=1586481 RepID=A0AAV8VMS5_9CUCU|nr:hypothetical protein NQ315_012411 [Exocentrus adspersus]